ncbi:hypothetical protein HYV50_03950 [Candidatus Pacearchaeota archaeon]|nr:hypothetical protein [Candidatus Pacearchaeota archaeon]
MKLKKCLEHGYTLEKICRICGEETKDAHYRFEKIRDVKEKKENRKLL